MPRIVRAVVFAAAFAFVAAAVATVSASAAASPSSAVSAAPSKPAATAPFAAAGTVAARPGAATRLSVRVAPATVKPGGVVTVSGTVSPKLKRAARLTVQLSRDGRSYSTVRTITLSKGARTYRTTVAMSATRGYVYLRVRLGTVVTPRLRLTVSDIVFVAIEGLTFTPKTTTVAPWTTVVWTNYDAVNHTVTAADSIEVTATPTGDYDSGPFAQDQTYKRLFVTPGTYFYMCTLHATRASMHAEIVVQ